MGSLCVTADIFHIHKLGLLETQRMTQIPGDICYMILLSYTVLKRKQENQVKLNFFQEKYSGTYMQAACPPH